MKKINKKFNSIQKENKDYRKFFHIKVHRKNLFSKTGNP